MATPAETAARMIERYGDAAFMRSAAIHLTCIGEGRSQAECAFWQAVSVCLVTGTDKEHGSVES